MSTLLVLSMILSMMIGKTSYAKENVSGVDVAVVETDQVAAATSTIVGPDGKTYTYLGTATDDNPLDVLLQQTIGGVSDYYYIAFYCPNNNGIDLIDVSLIASPVLGGTVVKYEFTNIRNEIYNINSFEPMRNGSYKLRVKAYAYGASKQGSVYYRIY